MSFFDVAVLGVPLLFVVIGAVNWVKGFGVTGRWLLVASMGTGLVFGGGTQLALSGFPIDFAGWFSVAFYGIGVGIVASNVYDGQKK